MEENRTILSIKTVISAIEQLSGKKAKLVNKYEPEFIIEGITEKILINVGFEYIGKSNKIGIECPMYELYNIEAMFVDTTLHIVDNEHEVIE